MARGIATKPNGSPAKANGHSNGHVKPLAIAPPHDLQAEMGALGTLVLAAGEPC